MSSTVPTIESLLRKAGQALRRANLAKEGGALAEQRSHLATFAELVKVTIPAHPLFATKQVSGAPFFIYWAGSSHNAKHRRRKCLHVGMFFWPEVATTNPRAPSEARRPLI